MLTVNDIRKVTKNLATKKALNEVKKDLIEVKIDVFSIKQEIKKIWKEMVTKDDFRKVMGLVESVFTEVKKMRDEQSFHIGIHERVDGEIDSLKKRVTRLETPKL